MQPPREIPSASQPSRRPERRERPRALTGEPLADGTERQRARRAELEEIFRDPPGQA